MADQHPRDACKFAARLELMPHADAATQQGPQKRRVRIFANSGKPIMHWYWDQFAVQLDGITVDKAALPMLIDHDPMLRAGTLREFAVTENGYEVVGEFLTSNPVATQALRDMEDGFPWQASVHVEPLQVLQVQAGESITVNGHELVGPGTVFTASRLREVSLCPLGADEATGAELLHNKGGAMSEKKVDPVQPATGPDLDAIRLEAVSAERERVAAILKVAHPKQFELAAKLASDGADLLAAVGALYEGLKAMCDQLLATIEAYTSANAPKEDAPADGEGDNAEEMSVQGKRKPVGPPKRLSAPVANPEEQWKLEYASNPEVKARMKESTYLALRRAEEAGVVNGGEA